MTYTLSFNRGDISIIAGMATINATERITMRIPIVGTVEDNASVVITLLKFEGVWLIQSIRR